MSNISEFFSVVRYNGQLDQPLGLQVPRSIVYVSEDIDTNSVSSSIVPQMYNHTEYEANKAYGRTLDEIISYQDIEDIENKIQNITKDDSLFNNISANNFEVNDFIFVPLIIKKLKLVNAAGEPVDFDRLGVQAGATLNFQFTEVPTLQEILDASNFPTFEDFENNIENLELGSYFHFGAEPAIQIITPLMSIERYYKVILEEQIAFSELFLNNKDFPVPIGFYYKVVPRDTIEEINSPHIITNTGDIKIIPSFTLTNTLTGNNTVTLFNATNSTSFTYILGYQAPAENLLEKFETLTFNGYTKILSSDMDPNPYAS